jgi:NAD(P)-dependent dehydrogenase (short-subunit alcohol dehydrogenase family)
MSSILITGANRGLGLEFTRQYAQEGWRVFACCRNPEGATALQNLARTARDHITIHPLEVTDHAQIESLARELSGEALDILLNNAGIYGPNKMALGHIDYNSWAEVLAVNVMAPLKMVECFLDHVVLSQRKIIASISSAMGSIAENSMGRHYLYRSSKAALNCIVKNLSIDLRDRHVLAVAINPGWVQTDMGGSNADLTPAQSVSGVRQVLSQLRPEDSGKFLSYDGSEVPW